MFNTLYEYLEDGYLYLSLYIFSSTSIYHVRIDFPVRVDLNSVFILLVDKAFTVQLLLENSAI